MASFPAFSAVKEHKPLFAKVYGDVRSPARIAKAGRGRHYCRTLQSRSCSKPSLYRQAHVGSCRRSRSRRKTSGTASANRPRSRTSCRALTRQRCDDFDVFPSLDCIACDASLRRARDLANLGETGDRMQITRAHCRHNDADMRPFVRKTPAPMRNASCEGGVSRLRRAQNLVRALRLGKVAHFRQAGQRLRRLRGAKRWHRQTSLRSCSDWP